MLHFFRPRRLSVAGVVLTGTPGIDPCALAHACVLFATCQRAWFGTTGKRLFTAHWRLLARRVSIPAQRGNYRHWFCVRPRQHGHCHSRNAPTGLVLQAKRITHTTTIN